MFLVSGTITSREWKQFSVKTLHKCHTTFLVPHSRSHCSGNVAAGFYYMDCFQCLIGLSSWYLLNQLSYRADCGVKINNYCAHQKFELCMSCYQLPGNMIGESCVICAIRQEWLSLLKYSMQCHHGEEEAP